MRPIAASSGTNRRVVLSTLAALPILFGPTLPIFAQAQTQTDPLPSWNDGPAKQSILNFVAAVTREGSPDLVSAPERIATFDNDGTLWVEQPMYVQLAFAIDRVKTLAPQHPEWKDKQPFKAALDGDMKTLSESGDRGMLELIMATHAGMSTGEFQRIVKEWLSIARHPRFNRPYTDLVYQPMIELLTYLRVNGFKTFNHCVRWRRRVHAAVERAGFMVFRPSRSWDRVSRHDSKCRTAFRSFFVWRKSISSMTGPVSRSASTSTSVVAPSRLSVTQTVISRCCNGPR